MKNFLLTLIVFSVLLLIGCQENSITDPVSNDPNPKLATTGQNSLDKDILSSYPGVIKLEGMLFDPSHYFNSNPAISGVVRYSIDYVKLARIPEDTPINIRLYVNAELKEGFSGKVSRSLFVSGTSEDRIYISTTNNDPVYYLEKSFSVKNSLLNLVLKFQVNEKSLTLISMNLFKVKIENLPIPDPEK